MVLRNYFVSIVKSEYFRIHHILELLKFKKIIIKNIFMNV